MMSNIDKLLNDLTLKEKVLLLSGFDAWHTNKIERLNIPSIKMRNKDCCVCLAKFLKSSIPSERYVFFISL